jgi:hypothetical protein
MNHRADEHRRQHPHEHAPRPSWWRTAHRDWRTWVAVALMLAGMAAYILSLDESLRPGGAAQPPVPIAP